MNEQNNTCVGKAKGLIDNFKLGLAVWLEGLKTILDRLLGNFELCQLEKRLKKEYALLGKITCGDTEGDLELCKKQIDFLKEEISKLKNEQTAKNNLKHSDNGVQ